MLLWQLGAEPFTAAAVAWGCGPNDRKLAVAGEPRNRDLAFRALGVVAHEFNRWFEAGEGRVDELPQIILPNSGNLTLLRRLGRRLAYLPIDGERAADPELVRFGLHLSFLADRARHPGQQLVLPLTTLVSSHWGSELSLLEAQSLPALDAMISPPVGLSGHQAAAKAERIEIGPVPSGDDDESVMPLLEAFNNARARNTDKSVVDPLLPPMVKHYTGLVDRGWSLMWRCFERERSWPEAASVARRVEVDLEALNFHVQFTTEWNRRYRTRQTNARAARTLRNWEESERLTIAEEAIDDPLRMVPFLLSGEALAGTVVSIDLDHREVAKVKSVLRPRLVIETTEPCLMSEGKELYWTKTPNKAEYVVVEVQEVKARRVWRVMLQHETGSLDVPRPKRGDEVIFSIHHTAPAPPLKLPTTAPWTHSAPASPEANDIEVDEAQP